MSVLDRAFQIIDRPQLGAIDDTAQAQQTVCVIDDNEMILVEREMVRRLCRQAALVAP